MFCLEALRLDRIVLGREQFSSPLGKLTLLTTAESRAHLLVLGNLTSKHFALLDKQYGALCWDLKELPYYTAARDALSSYFAGDMRSIDRIEDVGCGTDFQEEIWRSIRRIPAGTVMTTRRLAASLGRSSSFRAVACAAAANPLPILVPSHRVVGTIGEIGGYGQDPALARWLLRYEGVRCDRGFAALTRSATLSRSDPNVARKMLS